MLATYISELNGGIYSAPSLTRVILSHCIKFLQYVSMKLNSRISHSYTVLQMLYLLYTVRNSIRRLEEGLHLIIVIFDDLLDRRLLRLLLLFLVVLNSCVKSETSNGDCNTQMKHSGSFSVEDQKGHVDGERLSEDVSGGFGQSASVLDHHIYGICTEASHYRNEDKESPCNCRCPLWPAGYLENFTVCNCPRSENGHHEEVKPEEEGYHTHILSDRANDLLKVHYL
mmetsp:Transcript_42610/g.69305  ORF Transcript_42610/g.69305 Transcript_42610/m.69305 type:complete len:227 (+) Transcript_42610:61-741(+)